MSRRLSIGYPGVVASMVTALPAARFSTFTPYSGTPVSPVWLIGVLVGVAVRLRATYTRPVIGPAFAEDAKETSKRGPSAKGREGGRAGGLETAARSGAETATRSLRMTGSCGTLESLSMRGGRVAR